MRIIAQAKTATRADHKRYLGGTFSGYPKLRALSHTQWRRYLQVFSACLNQEQKKRFLERIEEPEKKWKFSVNDAKERHYWKDYMEAYENMIRNTATKAAPWYVVPADNKWFTRVVVAAAVIGVLDDLDLKYPEVSDAKLTELAAAKKDLLAGK